MKKGRETTRLKKLSPIMLTIAAPMPRPFPDFSSILLTLYSAVMARAIFSGSPSARDISSSLLPAFFPSLKWSR